MPNIKIHPFFVNAALNSPYQDPADDYGNIFNRLFPPLEVLDEARHMEKEGYEQRLIVLRRLLALLRVGAIKINGQVPDERLLISWYLMHGMRFVVDASALANDKQSKRKPEDVWNYIFAGTSNQFSFSLKAFAFRHPVPGFSKVPSNDKTAAKSVVATETKNSMWAILRSLVNLFRFKTNKLQVNLPIAKLKRSAKDDKYFMDGNIYATRTADSKAMTFQFTPSEKIPHAGLDNPDYVQWFKMNFGYVPTAGMENMCQITIDSEAAENLFRKYPNGISASELLMPANGAKSISDVQRRESDFVKHAKTYSKTSLADVSSYKAVPYRIITNSIPVEMPGRPDIAAEHTRQWQDDQGNLYKKELLPLQKFKKEIIYTNEKKEHVYRSRPGQITLSKKWDIKDGQYKNIIAQELLFMIHQYFPTVNINITALDQLSVPTTPVKTVVLELTNMNVEQINFIRDLITTTPLKHYLTVEKVAPVMTTGLPREIKSPSNSDPIRRKSLNDLSEQVIRYARAIGWPNSHYKPSKPENIILRGFADKSPKENREFILDEDPFITRARSYLHGAKFLLDYSHYLGANAKADTLQKLNQIFRAFEHECMNLKTTEQRRELFNEYMAVMLHELAKATNGKAGKIYKEWILAEGLQTFHHENQREPLCTRTVVGDYTVLQIEYPLLDLTKEQCKEFSDIFKAKAEQPQWFSDLPSFAQNFLKIKFSVNGDGQTPLNDADIKKAYRTYSAVYKVLPSLANFSTHKTIILDKEGNVISNYEANRSGSVVHTEIKNKIKVETAPGSGKRSRLDKINDYREALNEALKKDKAERERATELNIAQAFIDKAEDYRQAFFKIWDIPLDQQANFEIPAVLETLLSPLPLLPQITDKSELMVYEKRKQITRLQEQQRQAKLNHTGQNKGLILITSNHSVDKIHSGVAGFFTKPLRSHEGAYMRRNVRDVYFPLIRNLIEHVYTMVDSQEVLKQIDQQITQLQNLPPPLDEGSKQALNTFLKHKKYFLELTQLWTDVSDQLMRVGYAIKNNKLTDDFMDTGLKINENDFRPLAHAIDSFNKCLNEYPFPVNSPQVVSTKQFLSRLSLLTNAFKNYVEMQSVRGRDPQKDRNRQVFRSAFEVIMGSAGNWPVHITCKSGKDRTGYVRLFADAMLVYHAKNGCLPSYYDADDKWKEFTTMVAELFLSRHQQFHAAQNSPGSYGLKNATGKWWASGGLIATDIKQLIEELAKARGIESIWEHNKTYSDLNRVKYKKFENKLKKCKEGKNPSWAENVDATPNANSISYSMELTAKIINPVLKMILQQQVANHQSAKGLVVTRRLIDDINATLLAPSAHKELEIKKLDHLLNKMIGLKMTPKQLKIIDEENRRIHDNVLSSKETREDVLLGLFEYAGQAHNEETLLNSPLHKLLYFKFAHHLIAERGIKNIDEAVEQHIAYREPLPEDPWLDVEYSLAGSKVSEQDVNEFHQNYTFKATAL